MTVWTIAWGIILAFGILLGIVLLVSLAITLPRLWLEVARNRWRTRNLQKDPDVRRHLGLPPL